MWVVEAVDALGAHLDNDGIHPRDVDGLPGIAFAPFLHAGWGAPDRQHDPVPGARLHDRARRARPHGGGDGDRGARGGLRHVADRRPRTRTTSAPAASCSASPPTWSRAASSAAGRCTSWSGCSCSRSTARRWRSRSSHAGHLMAGPSVRRDRRRGRRPLHPRSSAISSSFVTVFQLRSVAATPSFARPSCWASSERPDPVRVEDVDLAAGELQLVGREVERLELLHARPCPACPTGT